MGNEMKTTGSSYLRIIIIIIIIIIMIIYKSNDNSRYMVRAAAVE
jgi:hypothetical protein